MRLDLALIAALTVWGCGDGNTEDKNDDAIRSEGDVLDIGIAEGEPDASLSLESSIQVGFDADGRESRLLLYFPTIRQLYEGDVVLSSITSIAVTLAADDVPINPEFIRLAVVTEPWSAQATWSSRMAILPGLEWTTPGGDVAPDIQAVTPDLKAHPSASGLIELSFDVTDIVTSMVAEGKPNYGFLLSVVRSPVNAAEAMPLLTFNSASRARRPKAELSFNKKDAIE